MTVNADTQPAVRAGGLPTNTPRTIQRPAQPVAGDAQSEVPAEAQSATPARQRRPYKPRKAKAPLNSGGLSKEELAAWGEIAIEARNAGVSVERFMADLEASVGLKLQVWAKLKPAQAEAGEGAEDGSEPAIQA